MIYDQVGERSASAKTEFLVLAAQLDARDQELAAQLGIEDSKQRCVELQKERAKVSQQRRSITGELCSCEETAFRELLAEEYGIPLDSKKFAVLYAYAWDKGHSAGFSEIEGKFIQVVELAKELEDAR